MSFQEKMEKARIAKEKREANQNKEVAKPKRGGLRKGKTNLTTGQYNILYAKIIDMLNEGQPNNAIHTYIRDYYKECGGYHLTNPYEVVSKAKALWLKNTELPSLENYKKEMYIKSERLESEIKQQSRRDITNQADSIINLWKHRDELAGLHQDNGIQVAIGISTDKKMVIDALEVGDTDETTGEGIQKDK